MRILIIHQYYLRSAEPGGSRFNEMARLWAAAGHEVAVVAGTVNYATGLSAPEYAGRWIARETDGEVTVWRCHVPLTYARSYRGRLWAFLVFTLTSIVAALRSPRPDVIIATSPPLTTAIPGWIAALYRRAKLVFEIRDLLPESAVTTGVLREGSVLTRMLYWLERRICGRADLINVLTPAFRDDLLRRRLAPESKIVLVPNGADLDLFTPGPPDRTLRDELGWGDRFVVMYAGAHGRAHGVGQLVEAAELLRDRPDIVIACVGDGTERREIEARAQRLGLRNILFHGPQPKQRMPALVRACDVGAAVLLDNPTFRTVYPNKIFDYMACERPVLLAIDGVARRLVCDEARAGIFAPPEDAAALASAIRSLADDRAACRRMGACGREWVLAHADRTELARRYLSHLMQLVRHRARRGDHAPPPGRTTSGVPSGGGGSSPGPYGPPT